ncbi:histone-lysine N-methyltransferase SETD2 [Asbolus verrucosus]|uniref:[histone H3]-lysine(36) N-trimethyltransferase n=1 Tax=Asbolus verrucosus TaxID=1661398 RepID=A0A482VWD9_ASBVE|nr:histone-lysine N-methyltransferase SETD2 [Asbolus verrucosus]
MPPKRKRGGQNQVTFVATKMSTRSCKKSNVKSGKVEAAPKSVAMPKSSARQPPKRGKPVAKARAKKNAARKRKIEVSSTQLQNVQDAELESILSELENDEKDVAKPHPIEEVYIKEHELMEIADIQNADTEACEIVEQLENLTVISEPAVLEAIDESEVVECVVDESNIEENVLEQVVEFDNYEGITVEYITEEFVPVVENAEIIIDEEVESSSDKPEEKNENVILDLSEQNDKEEAPPEIKTEEEAKPEIAEEPEPKPEVQQTPEEAEIKPEKPKPKKKATKKDPKEPRKPQPKKKPKPKQPKKDINADKTEEVRRSSRIKSINVQKQRSKGHGLVKPTKSPEIEAVETTNSSLPDPEKSSDSVSMSSIAETDNKPVKVKSRWRRSSELEMNVLTPAAVVMETCGDSEKIAEANGMLMEKLKPTATDDEEVETRLKQFVHLKENLYLTDRMACKEAKKMTCDCFLTPEDTERGEWGCGEDCLNRLLMIECGNVCPVGDRCTNKKFQKSQFAPVEVFKTEKKGLGLRAAANIPYGEFILEYVGEVLDHEEFDIRADDYSNDKNKHYYFMSLRADAIIDATMKGNISRFINHSCDPNAETQKWTVNGELRIGFFSTRTILAGEEITFDYRFQRYGKEAQKCYCEAPTCRGWLGEEPDDEDDEDEEDEEEEIEEGEDQVKEEAEGKIDESVEKTDVEVKETKTAEEVQKPPKKEKKKRSPRRKPRKDIFEDLDQLDEEIEMLVTTGLKNQAHTLKLSRLMVRAKEPAQRTKLLRILRRGELPCRRLFLDYHGLRLMHGYMTDAQHLAKTDKKYESLRLEMLQTLATLPIPNKTMLQDSKVLSTVEKWSSNKGDDLPMDSDSSSPQTDQDPSQTPTDDDKRTTEAVAKKEVAFGEIKTEEKEVKNDENEIRKSVGMDYQGATENGGFASTHGKELADEISEIFQEDMEMSSGSFDAKTAKANPEIKSEERNYEEEITALAVKLLEEWSNLKEVFKIPKKERIEQMKEHEREANRGYIAGLGLEQDSEKKNESRYRILKRYRSLDKIDNSRKNIKLEDRGMNYPKLGKFERRKMFALQVEQREEERRRKQREMWRQHEQHCILLGTDPRLTAPFDPNRGYQCIWNPQIGQWQNYPIQNPNMIFNPQNANPNFPYMQANLHAPGMIPGAVNPIHPLPSLPYQEEVKKEEDYTQVKFMGPIPPPVKLPPKWKCAKDKYGRPYYYHIKIRKSQWEPPPFAQPQEEPDDSSETTSSSDTSSLSSDTSSEESDSEEEVDDSKLLMEVRKQMEKQVKTTFPKTVPIKSEDADTPSPAQEDKEDKDDNKSDAGDQASEDGEKENPPSVDVRLKDILKDEKQQSSKRRRSGLVHEIIISVSYFFVSDGCSNFV